MLKVTVSADHRPAQVQEEPAGWGRFFRFFFKMAKMFCKVESKFLNSRVLAGGFVMGCAKKSWF